MDGQGSIVLVFKGEKSMFLCKIGLHDYDIIYKGEYDKTGIPKNNMPTIRQCLYCNKKQELEIHCLGLNPSEYMNSWLNIQ